MAFDFDNWNTCLWNQITCFFIFQNYSIRIKSFFDSPFFNRTCTIFRNVTHLCNYGNWLYIERVLWTRQIFKLNLPRLKLYPESQKQLLFRVFRFRIESVMSDIVFSCIVKMTTNDSHIILHIILHLWTLVFRVFRFRIESVIIDIVFSSIVKMTTNDSHMILYLLTLVLKPIWYSNISSYLFNDITR